MNPTNMTEFVIFCNRLMLHWNLCHGSSTVQVVCFVCELIRFNMCLKSAFKDCSYNAVISSADVADFLNYILLLFPICYPMLFPFSCTFDTWLVVIILACYSPKRSRCIVVRIKVCNLIVVH